MGLMVLFALLLMNGCNPSANDQTPAAGGEEYSDFTKEATTTAPVAENDKPAALKNTATFHTVQIKLMKFMPEVLTLQKGTPYFG